MSNPVYVPLSGDLAAANGMLESIVESLNDKLDRDPSGGQANQMTVPLDMNGQKILNIAPPTSPNDVIRLRDVELVSSGIPPTDGQDGKVLTVSGDAVVWELPDVVDLSGINSSIATLESDVTSVEDRVTALESVTGSNTYAFTGNITATGVTPYQVATKTGTGDSTVTLTNSTFESGDIMVFHKPQAVGQLTLTTTVPFVLPDGTSDTSIRLTDGVSSSLAITYTGTAWEVRVY